VISPAPQPAPELIGGVPADWLAMLGELIRKEGRAFRQGDGPWIEIQNLSTGRFEPIALEKTRGGITFATIADRDEALRAIERIVYPVLVVESAPAAINATQQHKLGNTLAALARR
jgi:hypothetical protein